MKTKEEFEACMIVYEPRETVYLRTMKNPVLDKIVKWWDKHVLKDEG